VRHLSLLFGVCMVGLLLTARPAAADIPPRGACLSGDVGKACEEAVDESGDVVGAGVCMAEKCTRATPDGAMTYDCAICRPQKAEPGAGGAINAPVPPTAGASTDPVEPSAGSTTIGPGGSSTSGGATHKPADKPDADDGGCSLGAGRRGAGPAGLMTLLILGLALGRRRLQYERA
jgi:hypothetical protein